MLLKSALRESIRRLSSSSAAGATSERTAKLGAYGSKASRGSGMSLMGGKRRGQGGLTAEEKAALERGELEDSAFETEVSQPVSTP